MLDALVEGADAGVVHEHVDKPEAAGVLHEGADGGGVGNIAGDGDRVGAEALRRLVEGLLAARADDDARARAHERLRDGVANPARAARDERGLPFEVHPGSLPLPAAVGV